MKSYNYIATFLIVALLLTATGCAPGDTPERFAKRYPVTGTVTINGKPIEKGSIIFTSAEDVSRGSESFVNITNGEYNATVTEGTKQVKISVEKPTGKIDQAGVPFLEETIPAKYNENSSLTADVPQEAVSFDFDLKL